MLKLEGVRVSISGAPILRDVSFELTAGRTTVLVGRNGAGKTTTLRAIMGLLPLDAGRLYFASQQIGDAPAYVRARLGIGYAPEQRGMIPEFSVEENILLPAYALKMQAATRRDRLEGVYELLPELKTLRSRSGGNVSGGQGKMVALGRALMVATSALLLDEPFQGLAPALALNYARALARIRARRNSLTIFVTESSPKLLDAVSSETLYIDRGAIGEAPESSVRM